jgi:hypothetical protein
MANEEQLRISRHDTIANGLCQTDVNCNIWRIEYKRGKTVPKVQRNDRTMPTALIVDDKPSIRLLMSRITERLGYIPIEAVNSADAEAIVKSAVRATTVIVKSLAPYRRSKPCRFAKNVELTIFYRSL